MSKRAGFKFMVVSGNRRSAVWSISINKNDVYVSSSISKQDKVSLHESGHYQWSLRTEALAKAPYVPETGRHIARWKNPQAPAGDFTEIFSILIAESELREDEQIIKKEVTLLPAPSLGFAAQMSFYFFDKPLGQLRLVEPRPLFSHQLNDGRILLLVYQEIEMTIDMAKDILSVHDIGLAEARRSGVEKLQAVVRITNSRGVSGLMEVSPRHRLTIFDSGEKSSSAHRLVPNGVNFTSA